MSERCVLVTGGAGFIGSHLVDALLACGCRVRVIDNFSTGRRENLSHLQGDPRLEVVEADIAALDRVQKHFEGVDTVFHLAALADIVPSIVHPQAYFHSNVTGTLSVLEACRAAKVGKVVYSASSSCYGIATELPTKETSAIDPQYPYALTKYLGEQLVVHWRKVYGMKAVSLRLFNVYGPRSRTSGTYGAVFGVFLAQKLAGRPFTVVGDGQQRRDFIFVTDVARAFVKAGFSDADGEIFNVGTGRPQSVNRLIELLGGEKIFIPKRPGEPDCTWADITKIRKTLDWEPEVAFEDGVKEIVEHIDYWRNAPVWTPENIAEATRDWFKFLKEKGCS
ncbi:MAG TPA: SDR family oxidoreductase [Candidatus Omnitrophota bacterium]|jgi:UDP-glucose 4-epimerase|nr:SDR family oxidoreductase [Candidatus Omnitrophota bacterium]HSA31583.1 SDR family oxidoreductase [Candidatus Omnitrophota bacterium]